jgi:hypothetical protein
VPRLIYLEPDNALPPSIVYTYGKAADGPDYGVSFTENMLMARPGASGYRPAEVMHLPANYGESGPVDVGSNKWIDNSELPHVALNPVNSPTYNLASPQGLFHLKVDNAEQYARWQVSVGGSNPNVPAPIPVDYNAAGPATLYGGK